MLEKQGQWREWTKGQSHSSVSQVLGGRCQEGGRARAGYQSRTRATNQEGR